jgi:hypothetical protein
MQSLLKSLFILFSLLVIVPSYAQTSAVKKQTTPAAPSQTAPKKKVWMTFEKDQLSLGRVKKGTKKAFDYHFTNTSGENIEIEIVSGCDCTTTDWTRGIIKPGGKGVINVIFDSTEKEMDEKNVDVDVYLKNKDAKTNSQILKILNYTFELYK